jgi:hemoglobin
MNAEHKDIPTLFTWAGGEPALDKLFDTFYKHVLEDELIGPVFRNMSPEHARHVAHFVGEVFRGHQKYTDEDGGSHSRMVAHHIGKTLDDTKRKRWIELLLQTADEVGLPDDPEFRSAFVGYLEWGSRLAVINSNATENPINESEPMPKWGWGETGGPYLLKET